LLPVAGWSEYRGSIQSPSGNFPFGVSGLHECRWDFRNGPHDEPRVLRNLYGRKRVRILEDCPNRFPGPAAWLSAEVVRLLRTRLNRLCTGRTGDRKDRPVRIEAAIVGFNSSFFLANSCDAGADPAGSISGGLSLSDEAEFCCDW